MCSSDLGKKIFSDKGKNVVPYGVVPVEVLDSDEGSDKDFDGDSMVDWGEYMPYRPEDHDTAIAEELQLAEMGTTTSFP